tara:strand:- start:863 stop:1408 length:546 start_codon:yes stop_codon:yes gene_type:complete
MQTCSICFEEKDSDYVSRCINCIESGISCHSCDLKWAKQSKDPCICTVCKNKTKENVSTESKNAYDAIIVRNITPSVPSRSHIVSPEITNQTSTTEEENNNNNEINLDDCNSCSKFTCWIIASLFMSWLFATFSYYVIFRQEKNILNNMHIAIPCGAIIGLPLLFYFRKSFKKNCLNVNDD